MTTLSARDSFTEPALHFKGSRQIEILSLKAGQLLWRLACQRNCLKTRVAQTDPVWWLKHWQIDNFTDDRTLSSVKKSLVFFDNKPLVFSSCSGKEIERWNKSPSSDVWICQLKQMSAAHFQTQLWPYEIWICIDFHPHPAFPMIIQVCGWNTRSINYEKRADVISAANVCNMYLKLYQNMQYCQIWAKIK